MFIKLDGKLVAIFVSLNLCFVSNRIILVLRLDGARQQLFDAISRLIIFVSITVKSRF
jgi:hypothetical protein